MTADSRPGPAGPQSCNLLVSCGQLPVTDLVRLFDAAKGFVVHIPHAVWAEYGGQGANSHDGGPPR